MQTVPTQVQMTVPTQAIQHQQTIPQQQNNIPTTSNPTTTNNTTNYGNTNKSNNLTNDTTIIKSSGTVDKSKAGSWPSILFSLYNSD